MISYLQVENVTKTFGEIVLFENISFSVLQDQKVALIARNGTGKTTLMNIINGNDTADHGNIIFKNDISIGYLPQLPDFEENNTILQEIFSSPKDIIKVIKNYETAIISTDSHAIATAVEQMDAYNAWDYEAKVKTILSKLNLNELNKPIKLLSGGQRKRLAIANVLIDEPEFLILDEPTNHLDVDMIEWLEEYLRKTRSTLLMVTHDRYFLDRVCNQIVEMDNNSVFQYNGNYSYFLQKRQERIELFNANAQKAQNLYDKELEWARKMPKARATKAKYRMDNVAKLKEQASTKFQEQNVNLTAGNIRIGKKILEIENISKSFDKLKIVENFSYSFVNEQCIGIVGSNGIGKTTFLELLIGNLPIDSGKIDKGQTIVFGYYKQETKQFDPNKRVIDIITEIAEIVTLSDGTQISAAKFLEYFLFPTQMHYSKLEKLSGGELKRLHLLTVLIKNPNFLILDEPTNDLDIATLSVLEEYLLKFKGCVIIVSHDRYFMDKVADTLFVFEGEGKISAFVGKYSDFCEIKEQQQQAKQLQNLQNTKEKLQNKPQREKTRKLTFKERQLLEQLEAEMPKMEQQLELLQNELSNINLPYEVLFEKSKQIELLKQQLDEKELQWLELSDIEQ